MSWGHWAPAPVVVEVPEEEAPVQEAVEKETPVE
jgi:hypothetical protein